MEKGPKEHNEQVGGLAGLGAGVLAGAAAGSLIPIPVVGTFTGALVGGLVGSEVGKVVGGVVLDMFNLLSPEASYPPPEPPGTRQPGGLDVLSQLERLSQLKSQGLISEEEFKAAKARLLGL